MSSRFRVLETALGPFGLVAGDAGLRHVYLPQRAASATLRSVRTAYPEAREDKRLLPELCRQLLVYAEGEPAMFDVPLDFTGAPPFHAEVWNACRQIPYGMTVSYKELAARVGRPGAARAVGAAMKANRFPIVVPCHRVRKSDGGLGGYSGPGGVSFKRRLLRLEAAATEQIA